MICRSRLGALLRDPELGVEPWLWWGAWLMWGWAWLEGTSLSLQVRKIFIIYLIIYFNSMISFADKCPNLR